MGKQLPLKLPTWGGKRKGAGRPRTRKHPGLVGPGVPHLPRPELNSRHPVHVTLRVQPGVGYLRAYRRAQILLQAFRVASERFGMRVAHYAILGNHLHLIVEAENRIALSRGMQGLAIRIAMRLNGLQKRRGGVFADRYYAHVLKTRRETARAVRYLRENYRRHTFEYVPPRWHDPLAGPLSDPCTWLLKHVSKFEGPGHSDPPAKEEGAGEPSASPLGSR